MNAEQLPIELLHLLLDLVVRQTRELPELSRAGWSHFFDVAENAAVGPTVAAAVLAIDGEQPHTRLPRQLAQQRAQDAAAVAAAWLADLHIAAAASLRVGVTPIALKGAALAAHRIISPEARHSHDIDLLIPAADAEACRIALLDAGCVELPDDPLPAVDGLPRSESNWRDPQIAFTCIGPFGTPLEVHKVASRISGGSFAELAIHCVPAALEGVDVLVPSVHRLRRMLNEHVFVSHLADPRLLLRHVADLAAIERWGEQRVTSAPTTWQRIDIRAGNLLLALARARAPEASSITRAQRFFLSRDGDAAAHVERVWHLLEAAEAAAFDLRYRPLFLMRRIVPDRRYLAALYDLPVDEAGRFSVHLRRWSELRSGLGGGRGRQ